MEKDILIVGNGLSALFMSKQCLQYGQSFEVMGRDSAFTASKVSGGVYNPVVAKRLVAVWNAQEQIANAKAELRQISVILKSNELDHPLQHYKLFKDEAELALWKRRKDREELKGSINPHFPNEISDSHINAPWGFAEICSSGWVNVPQLCEKWFDHLKEKNLFVKESFLYSALESQEGKWIYAGKQYRHIVFCEGFGMKNNPYFNYLPLRGLKGETVVVHAPGLAENALLKKDVFVLPLGKHNFLIGATFDRHNLDAQPTEEGKEQLLRGFEDISSCAYSVIEHRAGIRPTVKDHKPLVGQHPQHGRMWVLNGLGARGVMLGASMAQQLHRCIFEQEDLDPLVDIKRFYPRH